MINQKGFSPILGLIVLAAIVAAGVIIFAVVNQKTLDNKQPTQVQTYATDDPKVDQKCRDRDYLGCDEGSEHATWQDDGKR
ncbi:hypothetical protein HYS97_02340 [Candidatus Daviesbacteria bacterium]|nr:hypothetical protein [Candidatus Daviesbacteria bacterium]